MKPTNRTRIVAMFLVLGYSTAAIGQGPAFSLEAVKQMYPRMSEAHMNKCDKNEDGLFERGEIACVSSLYSALYRSN